MTGPNHTKGEAAVKAQQTSDTPNPTPANEPTLPRLGLRGSLRFIWRQLTSMNTALVLLLLLAVAAVPGSLLPQRSVNPAQTDQFLAENGWWGELLDWAGFFEVFTSPWFSAIYLLLFISLVGCVLPRCVTYARQVVAQPPRTPRRLTRFTGYTRRPVEAATAQEIQDRAGKRLKRTGYRVRHLEEETGALSVSAERGYLREAGNLVFHLALLGVLIGVGLGYLTSYRGQITVVEGEGFANSLTGYDTFESGAWFNPDDLPPFRFTLDEFRAEFSTDTSNPKAFGLPTKFEADLTVEAPGRETFRKRVRVNEPLEVDGASAFLLGNGYAPILTVRDPEGNVVADGPVRAVSNDKNYTGQIVLKMPDASPKQMALVGIFAPTAVVDERGPHSTYAGLVDPKLFLTAHTGDLGLDTGVPTNAYQIDVSTLDQVTQADGKPLLMSLSPGESYDLPDGSSIEFRGVKRYAAFDVKHDPWQGFTLAMALTAAAGLMLSLFIPRRRLWVRAIPAGEGVEIEVAGLARSEDFALASDVARLADHLAPASPSAVPRGKGPRQ